MKKIDYYILREFSNTFLIVSLFFTLISLIVDIFENLNRFIDNQVTMDILTDYYIASLPSMISVTIPVSCLVSSVFTYGMMIQRKEWLVFKSSGLSLYRLSFPVLLLGLMLSIGSFYFDNSVVIENNKKKNEIKNTYMSKNKNKNRDKSVFENVYFQMNEKDLVALEKFNSNNNVAVNLSFIEIDNGVLISKVIDGRFPDYKKVVPSDNEKVLQIKLSEFKNSIERVTTVSSDRKEGVKMNISQDLLQLSVNSPNSGEGVESVNIKFNSDNMSVSFNGRYLIDIVSQIEDETIIINLKNPASPALIKDLSDTNSFHVVMPMKI